MDVSGTYSNHCTSKSLIGGSRFGFSLLVFVFVCIMCIYQQAAHVQSAVNLSFLLSVDAMNHHCPGHINTDVDSN